jgi:glutathione S-transferase
MTVTTPLIPSDLQQTEHTSAVILHQIPGAWGLPSLSPFCLKLETYLRIMGIPFQPVIEAGPFTGPRKKLPWIEHEGMKLGDSGFIIEYLERRFQHDASNGLCETDKAIAHAMRRLIEENLAWALAYDRWLIDSTERRLFRNIVLGKLPTPLRLAVAPLARRGVRRQLHAQGLGRHSPEEVHGIGKKDVRTIATLLGNKPFLMGDRPGDIDASAYGVLANIMKTPLASPIQDEAMRHANLVDFVNRVQQLYFT